MTVPQAAKVLGISEQAVRCWIQTNRCPFGYVIREGKQRKSYYISEGQLNNFISGTINNAPKVGGATNEA